MQYGLGYGNGAIVKELCTERVPDSLPQVGGQSQKALAVRSGLEPGQPHEKAVVDGRLVLTEDEALDADQYSEQTDQDERATVTPTPCQNAGVSARRGATDRVNRETGVCRQAPPDNWLACFKSTGFMTMGSSGADRLP